MLLLQTMYGVPIKWESCGSLVQWYGCAIPDSSGFGLLRLDVPQVGQMATSVCTKPRKVMKGQIPALFQKSLWYALLWFEHLQFVFRGLGFHSYGTVWWVP